LLWEQLSLLHAVATIHANVLIPPEMQTIPLQTPFAPQTAEPQMGVIALGGILWMTAIGTTFARLQGE